MRNPDTVATARAILRAPVVFGKESPSGMRNPETVATAGAISRTFF
jgi:hypothetical protein